MSDLSATTVVTVELNDRPATIADIRAALNILTNEGIPETFEVRIYQRRERKNYAGEAEPCHLSIEADRAGRTGG